MTQDVEGGCSFQVVVDSGWLGSLTGQWARCKGMGFIYVIIGRHGIWEKGRISGILGGG